MTSAELILKQVKYVRECMAQAKEDALAAVADKNELSCAESTAKLDLASGNTLEINGKPLLNKDKKPIKFSNDISRKGYIEKKTQALREEFNASDAIQNAAYKQVMVEISVLSAFKEISRNESFDDDLLAKYDIISEEEGGI